MYELINSSLSAYISAAAFTGFCVLLAIFETFKRTKNMESKKIKTALRFGVNGVLVCFWLWFFIYVNLLPISLAYYEYNHDLAEEKTGVIESIEQDTKDRIYIIIDNTEYVMVHSSSSPAVIIGRDIDEGDTVKVKFGERSKFIFEIFRIE